MDEYEELMQKCVEEFKRRREIRLKQRRRDEIAEMKAYLASPEMVCPEFVCTRVESFWRRQKLEAEKKRCRRSI